MTDQITEWLDGTQQLADQATGGPWAVDTDTGELAVFSLSADALGGTIAVPEDLYPRGQNRPAQNMTFIAEARTRLPQAVEALREVVSICGEHFDGQMRRAEKLGRSVPDCSCEVCRVVLAVEAALGLEGDDDEHLG